MPQGWATDIKEGDTIEVGDGSIEIIVERAAFKHDRLGVRLRIVAPQSVRLRKRQRT
jgi:pyruvate kinase